MLTLAYIFYFGDIAPVGSVGTLATAEAAAIVALWYWVRGEIKECREDRRQLWKYILGDDPPSDAKPSDQSDKAKP